MDSEKCSVAEKDLVNTNVHNITWRDIKITARDRQTKLSKTIVDNVEGIVKAGSCNLEWTFHSHNGIKRGIHT